MATKEDLLRDATFKGQGLEVRDRIFHTLTVVESTIRKGLQL